MSHIRRIGLTLYVRFTIPKDRWADCGSREVVRTLQTRDLSEARKRLGPALAAIQDDLNTKLTAKGLPALSGGWKPSWDSRRGLVDRAISARAELERAPDKPRYGDEGQEYGSVKDDVRDHIMDEAAEVAETQGSKGFETFYDIATGARTPIAMMADRWLAAEASRLRAATVLQHRTALRRLGTFLALADLGRRGSAQRTSEEVLAEEGMEGVSKNTASRFLEWLEQDQKLAPKTIARLHSSLNMLWKWAAKREVVASNVWQGLSEGLQAKNRRRQQALGGHRPYEADEAIKLLLADPNRGRRWSYGAAVHDLLRLALLTGARANELCSLRVRDITREGTGMAVDEAVSKTGNATREVPLCQSASKTFQGTASKSFQLIVSRAPTDCVVWAGTEAPGYRDRRAPSVASKAFRELGCLEIFDMAAQLQHGVERLRRCAVFET